MRTKQIFIDNRDTPHETEKECLLADAEILLHYHLEECSAERVFYLDLFLPELRKNTELRKALKLVIKNLELTKPLKGCVKV